MVSGLARFGAAGVQRCFFEAHFQLRFLSLLGGLLGGSWAILAPKRLPNGAQKGAQSVKKSGLQRAFASRLVLGAIFRWKICLFRVFFVMFFQCIVWPMEEGNA